MSKNSFERASLGMKKRNDNRQLLNNEKIKNLLKDYKYTELSGKDTMDFLIE